jgi:serine/threonine protein kinase
MAIGPGTRVGPYEITALIGEGGMGQVYRATDTPLDRQVAIKILPGAFTSDPDSVQWSGGHAGHGERSRLRARGRAVRGAHRVARRSAGTTEEHAMKKSNFALRLQPSLMEEARKVAKAEGVAVAEKVSALRTQEYFAERARRGDVREALRVLKRAGAGQPPMPGDELPGPASRKRR